MFHKVGSIILQDIDAKMLKIRRDLQEKLNSGTRDAVSMMQNVQKALDSILIPKEQEKEPKNWNDLSKSLKLKCIREMGFMTKIHVAKTSRTEKALVDSLEPIIWDTVTLKLDDFNIRFIARSKKVKITKKAEICPGCAFFECPEPSHTKKLSQLIDALLFVFKKGDVHKFGVSESELFSDPPQLLLMLRNHAPFRYREFWMDGGHSVLSTFFINHRQEKLEKLHIVGMITSREIRQFGADQFADMVKNFKLGDSRQLQYLVFSCNQEVYLTILMDVLQQWLVNDAEIGTRLIAYAFHPDFKFADIVKELLDEHLDKYRFLIRKDSENAPKIATKPKSILIREEMVDSMKYLSCVVIPTKLRPSEYENAKNWFWRAPTI